MRLYAGERNTARSPAYASLSRLRSVKGRCARLRLPFYEHQIVKGLH